MELEDLKTVWEEYDQRLNKSLTINEEILKKINLTNAKNEMNAPLIMEIINLILMSIVLLVCFVQIPKVLNSPFYLGSAVVTILIIIFSFVGAIKKVSVLMKIDYYNQPILEIQELILRYEKIYLWFKKVELILAPVLMASAIFFGTKIVHQYDLLAHPFIFLRAFIICVGVGLPLSLWLYKHLYEKRTKRSLQFLKDIKEFEEELK